MTKFNMAPAKFFLVHLAKEDCRNIGEYCLHTEALHRPERTHNVLFCSTSFALAVEAVVLHLPTNLDCRPDAL